MPKPVVTLTTAHKLTSAQLTVVKNVLKQKLGSFELKHVIKPNLMGGLKIQLGKQEFDASLEGKLKKLEPQLAEVKVFTVVPINQAQRAQIQQLAENKLGPVKIVETIDPNLIGGIKIIMGSTAYDGSIKHKLELIKQQLIASI